MENRSFVNALTRDVLGVRISQAGVYLHASFLPRVGLILVCKFSTRALTWQTLVGVQHETTWRFGGGASIEPHDSRLLMKPFRSLTGHSWSNGWRVRLCLDLVDASIRSGASRLWSSVWRNRASQVIALVIPDALLFFFSSGVFLYCHFLSVQARSECVGIGGAPLLLLLDSK